MKPQSIPHIQDRARMWCCVDAIVLCPILIVRYLMSCAPAPFARTLAKCTDWKQALRFTLQTHVRPVTLRVGMGTNKVGALTCALLLSMAKAAVHAFSGADPWRGAARSVAGCGAGRCARGCRACATRTCRVSSTFTDAVQAVRKRNRLRKPGRSYEQHAAAFSNLSCSTLIYTSSRYRKCRPGLQYGTYAEAQ
eukprot:IDg17957t1